MNGDPEALRMHADCLLEDGCTHMLSLIMDMAPLKPWFPEIFGGKMCIPFEHMLMILYLGADILETEAA